MNLKKVLKGCTKEEVALTLKSITEFNRVVKNYLKIIRLSNHSK